MMEHDYFESYDNIEVHRIMLKDKPRTEAYRDAILKNEHLFKGKLVMDLGAGTGILSLLLAKAGARKVYAIEASNLAKVIPLVAEENGYADVIEVFHTKVEDFSLPTEEKVDAIISEWMGFYLLHESMLPSVLFARDNFLADNGVMFPSKAKLSAAPCSLESFYTDQFYFWDNIFGFSMSSLKKFAFQSKACKPEICEVQPSDLLAEATLIKSFDLRADTDDDIKEFSCTNFVGISKSGNYQGLAIWFECIFDGKSYDCTGSSFGASVCLSTSPFHPVTHWKQTVIIFGALNVCDVEAGDIPHKKCRTDPTNSQNAEEVEPDGEDCTSNQERMVEEDEVVGWKLEFKRNKEKNRHYDITFEMLDPEETEHPIPCMCPMPRCLIIAKMLENDERDAEESDSDPIESD